MLKKSLFGSFFEIESGEEMKQKVLVGMSGGVDSSVCTTLLIDKGYETAGVTLRLFESEGCKQDENNVRDAKAVCERLGIKHYAVDLKQSFKHFVIENFINEYINGATPNPCIECNRNIKFGEMIEKAKELGYEKIATGHYARVKETEDGRFLLLRAADVSKDQSYVLYCLNQAQLSRVLFPLGELTKAQVRDIATERGFVNANKPDSQDICFVPDGDYASFIEEYSNFVSKKGDYLDINGEKIGEHKGVIHYTIGQRKGLGIALGKPAFVIEKNAQNNTVTIGDEEHIFHKKVWVNNVNFIPFDKLEKPMNVKTKLRYRHEPEDSTITPLENGEVLIEFSKPQRAASIGQAAVFYDGDIVVGGGTIIE